MKDWTGEDVAIVGLSVFAMYVVYQVVVKPTTSVECEIGNDLKDLKCFLSNPFTYPN
jgi:hypothetical protein